jgi:hypothetical protein
MSRVFQSGWRGLCGVLALTGTLSGLVGIEGAVASTVGGLEDVSIAAPAIHRLQVAAARLEIHAGPDTGTPVLAVVERGRLLDVLAERGDWFEVKTGSTGTTSGWVLRRPGEYGDWSVIPVAGGGDVRFAESAVGSDQEPAGEVGRQRPGNRGVPLVTLPPERADQLPPPPPNLPRESIPLPDRWRLMQALGFRFPWYDPYNQNVLKGDLPVTRLGDDMFIIVGAIFDGLAEFRQVPTPVSPSLAFGDTATDSLGVPDQQLQAGTLLLNLAFTKGNTTYMPPEVEVRFAPVFTVNRAEVREAGVVRADPLDCGSTRPVGDDGDGPGDGSDGSDDGLDTLPGSGESGSGAEAGSGSDPLGRLERLNRDSRCVRVDSFVGIQEFFVDYHLRDVSDRYDFDSIRVGIQPYNNDFRGFLFQDLPFGVRLFGNRANNVWQYNLGWFRRIEKDTNSGLNDIWQALRKDDLFLANVYRQDFPIVGFTSGLSLVHNRNREQRLYRDDNGFVVRPAVFGSASRQPSPYSVTYLGYAGDGHLRALWPRARVNWTTASYLAIGEDDFNPVAGRSQNIRAFFHASELSRDFSWMRIRGSLLFASGDDDPRDGRAGGFDAVFENPQFAGADTSYWVRQGIPLVGGGGVALSGRNGVLTSLRSSKELGQSNFVNPGLFLAGLGADFDLSPEVRLVANANHLRFARVETLEFLRAQQLRSNEIGWDLSTGIQWRPFFNQNVVVNASGAVLFAGRGLRELYGSERADTLYSVFINGIFTF